MATKYPKLIVGHTYRLTFTPSAERVAAAASGGPAYQAEVARPCVQEWKVTEYQGHSAGALRAHVMRWTTRGKNTAEVVDITEEVSHADGELIGQPVLVTYADDGLNEILAKRGTLVSLEPDGDTVFYVLANAEVLPKGTGEWRPTGNDDGRVEGGLGLGMGTLEVP
jgi:hypothetical protein